MTDFIIQGSEPVIKIDSLGIGIKSQSNVESLSLNDNEYLVVGDGQGNPNGNYSNDQFFTKNNLYVNHQGVAINTSRYEMLNHRDLNTSLYVSKNIHCDGIINAIGGIQFGDIKIASNVNSDDLKNIIKQINVNTHSQLFKVGVSTYFTNRDISYPVNNIYSPNYITLGGRVDTYNNKHPLHINSTPNNDFNNIHLAIRNDASDDTNNSKLSKLSFGIIGGSYTSPAVIATTPGMPLEFHISKDASVINDTYKGYAIPTYLNDVQYPAMAIDSNGTVCIGKNKSEPVNFTRPLKEPLNSHICKLDVKGTSIFDDILIRDNRANDYKHIDEIYVRATDIGIIKPSQIDEGIFYGENYIFNCNISISKLLTTENINSKTLNTSNINAKSIIVENDANFRGIANFTSVNQISINKLNVTSDLFIGGKRINAVDIDDPALGYKTISNSVGNSNFFFTYVHSNIASLHGDRNIRFPNRLSVGNSDFSGILNVFKDDKSQNNFEVVLNTEDNIVAKIGRVLYTGLDNIDDKSLVINTNKIDDIKKNNIYFYPSYNIENLQSDPSYPPTLSITDKGVGINNKLPRADLHLDIKGKIAATDYYVSKDDTISKMSGFINKKDYFNIYNENISKYCINYDSISSVSSKMKGLNVKNGINSDAYYQNDKLIETLKSTTNLDGFYTNNKIAIGWNNSDHLLKVPLQIRNTTIEDYNYSVIRIYRGVNGKGINNDAAFSGIDICENERDEGNDRNLERWFIYKNHRHNDSDSRDIKRIGPLQFGYTDKTIDPKTFGMSMYYNDISSNYHIDFNNPIVNTAEIPKSAVSIYGDLDVYGSINIIDNNSNDFNFRIKKLEDDKQYVKYHDINSVIYSSNVLYNKIIDHDDVEYSGKNIIFTPLESIIVDSVGINANAKIPFVVKQNNMDRPVAKFITYSSSNTNVSSAIELCIYGSNEYTTSFDNNNIGNIKNKVKINVENGNNDNTKLSFSYHRKNLNDYKPFVEFNNINNSKTYMRLGQDGNIRESDSNITLHINDNNKCGIQITNTQEPIRINMVNCQDYNKKYTILSSGNSSDNFKFNIGIANTELTNIDDVVKPNVLKNVFTISPYSNDNKLLKGARFGLNEPNPQQTVVINSEYDNNPFIITGRYTQDNIYTNIKYTSNLTLPPVRTYSCNLYSEDDSVAKEYRSEFKYNIPLQDIGNVDIYGSTVAITNDSIVYKTLHDVHNISYLSIHSNIDLSFDFNNIIIENINNNNYNFVVTQPNNNEPNRYNVNFSNLHGEELFNIYTPLTDYSIDNVIKDSATEIKVNYASNIDIGPDTFNMNLLNVTPPTEIQIDYAFYNSYKIPSYLRSIYTSNKNYTSNIYSSFSNGVTSNIITINNEIYTYLIDNRDKVDETYKREVIKKYTTNKLIDKDNSTIFLSTITSNIFIYNHLTRRNGLFDIHRTNRFNIYNSNIIPNTKTNSNYNIDCNLNIRRYDIVDVGTSNLLEIKTSNVFIDNMHETELVPYESIELKDNFIITKYNSGTLSNTIKLTEYYRKYKANANDIINIQLTNYNNSNFNPQIILSNNVEDDKIINRDKKIHKIYSYDGNFKIKYEDNLRERDLLLIKSDGDLHITGDIYKNNVDIIKNINANIYLQIGNLNDKIDYGIDSTSNYVLSTSNILISRILKEIDSTSNYVLSTSNILVPRILREIDSTSNYVLSTSNILVPRILSEALLTSNIISDRINKLTTDMIIEEPTANQKFIVNKRFNNDLTVNGILTVTSNLIVQGDFTRLETITYTTENLEVININEDNIALKVYQNNAGVKDIFVASKNGLEVFNITKDGDVNIIGNYKKNNRDVMQDTSNYVVSTSDILMTNIILNDSNSSNYVKITSNIFITHIADTSNYIKNTSNNLNNYINSKSPWEVIDSSNIIYQSNVNIMGELRVDGTISCKEVRLLSSVNIIGSFKQNNRDVILDTSNYVESTSNNFAIKINYNDKNISNYVADTSNYLNQYINNKSPWIVIDNNNIIYNSNVKVGVDLYVEGDIYCKEVKMSSSISDDRLKDCTSNIKDPIDLINKLNGFHYVPNNLAQQYGFKKINDIGLSAQEVQNILPEIVKLAPFDMARDDYNNLVSKSGDNYLTICYEKMAPLFVESIKTLKKEIDDLRLEVAELRNNNK